ncbi:MAG TPA: aldo/keto reductase [Tepidisphaeraceae bacterium]|jgi:aryl-alcohol dehydrogenase-like predicted oxidoreductase
MIKTRFGKTGFDVTPLGFGAAEIGFLKPQRDQAAGILNMLLDEGVNVIDTAAGYETSEETIGDAISHRRSQYVLISKCGHCDGDIKGEPWTASVIAQTIERSLRRLKTDHLDVMLLHTCDEAILRKGEALNALVKAKTAGKVRFIGYSGDNQAVAYAATLPEVDVIETSINIADQVNIDLVLPLARKHDVGVLAKRPLANAAWKKTEDQPGFYGKYAEDYKARLAKMKINPAELGISGPPELAWPELALRFAMSQAGAHSAIIGTASPQNTRRNIEFAKKGPLPPEVVQKIRGAFKAAQGGENWPGLT